MSEDQFVPAFSPPHRLPAWLPPAETRKAIIDIALSYAPQLGDLAAKSLAWDLSAALDAVEQDHGVQAAALQSGALIE